jgi:hypothetical protein
VGTASGETDWAKGILESPARFAAPPQSLAQAGSTLPKPPLEVGFDSLSHFNETLHSFMGVPPKDFVPKEHMRFVARRKVAEFSRIPVDQKNSGVIVSQSFIA